MAPKFSDFQLVTKMDTQSAGISEKTSDSILGRLREVRLCEPETKSALKHISSVSLIWTKYNVVVSTTHPTTAGQGSYIQ